MGHNVGLHRRLGPERAVPGNAGDPREGHHQGQTGLAERVRVSCLQDQAEGPDVRVDV